MPKVNPVVERAMERTATNKAVSRQSTALLPAGYIGVQQSKPLEPKIRVKIEPVDDTEKVSVNVSEYKQVSSLTNSTGFPCKNSSPNGDDTENTLTASESDSDTTVWDTDGNMESDSTIPEGHSTRKKKRRNHVFVKEELMDTEEESDSETLKNSTNAVLASYRQEEIAHKPLKDGKNDCEAAVMGNVPLRADIPSLKEFNLLDKAMMHKVSCDKNLLDSSTETSGALNSVHDIRRQNNLLVSRKIEQIQNRFKTNGIVKVEKSLDKTDASTSLLPYTAKSQNGAVEKASRNDNTTSFCVEQPMSDIDRNTGNALKMKEKLNGYVDVCNLPKAKKIKTEPVSDSSPAVNKRDIKISKNATLNHSVLKPACTSDSQPYIGTTAGVLPVNATTERNSSTVSLHNSSLSANGIIRNETSMISSTIYEINGSTENVTSSLDSAVKVRYSNNKDILNIYEAKTKKPETEPESGSCPAVNKSSAQTRENTLNHGVFPGPICVCSSVTCVVKNKESVLPIITSTEENRLTISASSSSQLESTNEVLRNEISQNNLTIGKTDETENFTSSLDPITEPKPVRNTAVLNLIENKKIKVEPVTNSSPAMNENNEHTSNITFAQNDSLLEPYCVSNSQPRVEKNKVSIPPTNASTGRNNLTLSLSNSPENESINESENETLQINQTNSEIDRTKNITPLLDSFTEASNVANDKSDLNYLNELNASISKNSVVQEKQIAKISNEQQSTNDKETEKMKKLQISPEIAKHADTAPENPMQAEPSLQCASTSSVQMINVLKPMYDVSKTTVKQRENFSMNILEYFDVGGKYTKREISECVNYLTTKYPEKRSFEAYRRSERTTTDPQTDNGMKVQVTPINKDATLPRELRLSFIDSGKGCSEYSDVARLSFAFIEECRKMMKTGIDVPSMHHFNSKGDFPDKSSSESNVSVPTNSISKETCCIHTVSDGNISGNLPSIESQKKSGENETTISSFHLVSSNHIYDSDIAAMVNMIKSPLSYGEERMAIVKPPTTAESIDLSQNTCSEPQLSQMESGDSSSSIDPMLEINPQSVFEASNLNAKTNESCDNASFDQCVTDTAPSLSCAKEHTMVVKQSTTAESKDNFQSTSSALLFSRIKTADSYASTVATPEMKQSVFDNTNLDAVTKRSCKSTCYMEHFDKDIASPPFSCGEEHTMVVKSATAAESKHIFQNTCPALSPKMKAKGSYTSIDPMPEIKQSIFEATELDTETKRSCKSACFAEQADKDIAPPFPCSEKHTTIVETPTTAESKDIFQNICSARLPLQIKTEESYPTLVHPVLEIKSQSISETSKWDTERKRTCNNDCSEEQSLVDIASSPSCDEKPTIFELPTTTDPKNILQSSCSGLLSSRIKSENCSTSINQMQEIKPRSFLEASKLDTETKRSFESSSSIEYSVINIADGFAISDDEVQIIEPVICPKLVKSNSNFENSSKECLNSSETETNSFTIPSKEELKKIINAALLSNVSLENTFSAQTNDDVRNVPLETKIFKKSEDSSAVISDKNLTTEPESMPEIIFEEIELLTVKKRKNSLQLKVGDMPRRSNTSKALSKDKTMKNKNKTNVLKKSLIMPTANETFVKDKVGKSEAHENFQESETNTYVCNRGSLQHRLKGVAAKSNMSDSNEAASKSNEKKNSSSHSFQKTKYENIQNWYCRENEDTEEIKDSTSTEKARKLVQNVPFRSDTASEPPAKKLRKIPVIVYRSNKFPETSNLMKSNSSAGNSHITKNMVDVPCVNLSSFPANISQSEKRSISNKAEKSSQAKRIKSPLETSISNETEKISQMKPDETSSESDISKTSFKRPSSSVHKLNSALQNEKNFVTSYPLDVPTHSQTDPLTQDQSISSTSQVSSKSSKLKKFEESSSVMNTHSSKEIDCDNRTRIKPSQVVFSERRGNLTSLSKCLYKNVGKHFINTIDLPSLIIEWNANWLETQKEIKKCAPICETYENVKYNYRNVLAYYNTYFPLHLLNIWLRISDSWKNKPKPFKSILENQEEKPNSTKVMCSTVLNVMNFSDWPKRDDIVLCTVTKPDKTEENSFGHVSNVKERQYSPPKNSSLEGRECTLRNIKIEFYCAESLAVPIMATVEIRILCNIRIAMIQNDALQHLNTAMKEAILDPVGHGTLCDFMSLQQPHDPTFHKCIKDIIQSAMSPEIRVTVVDTSSPCDELFAILQLAVGLMKKRSPVLIGVRNEESFLRLAKSLKHCNLVLALKKKEVKLPEEFRKYTLEERLAKATDGKIFNKWHVTLTLVSRIFLGNSADAFADQNLTCILHEAHLCTEAETALLLYYDVKNVILMGKRNSHLDMHHLLKRFGFNISFYNRLCEANSHSRDYTLNLEG